jgi:hypothetical protein
MNGRVDPDSRARIATTTVIFLALGARTPQAQSDAISGHVCSLTITCTGSGGAVSAQTASVLVPHNQ